MNNFKLYIQKIFITKANKNDKMLVTSIAVDKLGMVPIALVIIYVNTSVPDPEPDPDPHVFGPPGSESGSTSQRCGSGSGSGSFYHHAKIVRKTLIPYIL